MATRRERFRDVLQRLDPIASTVDAFVRGWVLPPVDSFEQTLRTTLELDLRQRYVLMGGVGSGKTTELLRLRDALNGHEGRAVVYVEVSRFLETGTMKRYALLAAIGLALSEQIPSLAYMRSSFAGALDRWVDYRFDDVSESRDPSLEFVEGVASPRSLARRYGELAGSLNTLFDRLSTTHGSALVLLDGLDRLWNLDVLEALVRWDLAIIHHIETLPVSTLTVAPLSLYLGSSQPLRGGFDREFLQPYRDPKSERDRAWLMEVLRTRGVNPIIPDALLPSLVTWSGGVLRDLIMLARLAVEEAYVRGAELVTPEILDSIALAFGRKILLGTGKDQVVLLQTLLEQGEFELIGDEHVDLLLHRRILFYDNNRYAVHPTLAPLLQRVKRTSHAA